MQLHLSGSGMKENNKNQDVENGNNQLKNFRRSRVMFQKMFNDAGRK